MSELYVAEVLEVQGPEITLRIRQVHPDVMPLDREGSFYSLILMLLHSATHSYPFEEHFQKVDSPLALAFDIDDVVDEPWLASIAPRIVLEAEILEVEKTFDPDEDEWDEDEDEWDEDGDEDEEEEEEEDFASHIVRARFSHPDWLIGFEKGMSWGSAAYNCDDWGGGAGTDGEPILPIEIVEERSDDPADPRGFFWKRVLPEQISFYHHFHPRLKWEEAKVLIPYKEWKNNYTFVAEEAVCSANWREVEEKFLGRPVVVLDKKEDGSLVPHETFVGALYGTLIATYPHVGRLFREKEGGGAGWSDYTTSENTYIAPLRFCRRYIRGLKREIPQELQKEEEVKSLPPILLLARKGNGEGVERLLEKEPKQIKKRSPAGWTALHLAIFHPEVVEVLLRHGMSVNKAGPPGLTPLMLASFFGVEETVEKMLTSRAKPNKRTPLFEDEDERDVVGNGWTAVDFAILSQQKGILEKLILQGGIFWGDWWQESEAFQESLPHFVSELQRLWHQHMEGAFALYWDAEDGIPERPDGGYFFVEALKKILTLDFEEESGLVHLSSKEKVSWLRVARNMMYLPTSAKVRILLFPSLWKYPLEFWRQVLRLLQFSKGLGEQANLLHYAAGAGDLERMKVLVEEYDMEVTRQDGNGVTPLEVAIAMNDEPTEVVQYLLEKGGVPRGGQALFLAIQRGFDELALKLLEMGVDVNSRGLSDITPLIHAAYLNRERVVRTLLQKGADVRLQDQDGDTALHSAAEEGHLNIVKLLVEAGSPLDVVNREGKTALQVAKEKNHREVVEYLEAL